ncbi:UNVERIFIED_CONTAM: Pentatricopeptide repeat-containing protein [Sesamum radiatum]|uniref:Pentatricopeptide repeat-containing protein n=1 Tax=Sesamum radiatum TaxID=300843 RepID=A0AAW2U8B5_SESRA
MSSVRCIFKKLSSPTSRPLILSWRCSSSFHVSISSHTSARTCTPNTEAELGFLVSSCGREGNIRLGSCLHASIVKNPPFFNIGDPDSRRRAHVTYNCLLLLYCKCGELYDAVKMFDDMLLRDTVSWNSLISGFLKHGHLKLGFGYFKSLVGSSIYRFDCASLTSVLSACGGLESVGIVKMIHALAILNGYEKGITVGMR